MPVQSDQALGEEVEALAHQIAVPNASGRILSLARGVAEAQFDLRRVRDARHQVLSEALKDPAHGTPPYRCKRRNSYMRLSAMNGVLSRDGNLPFEHSIQRAAVFRCRMGRASAGLAILAERSQKD